MLCGRFADREKEGKKQVANVQHRQPGIREAGLFRRLFGGDDFSKALLWPFSGILRIGLVLAVFFLLGLEPSWAEVAPDSKDVGGTEEKEPQRPLVSGWHSWRYNKFSSYDQLRVNFEKESAKGQKFLTSFHGLYYLEDDHKSWNTYLGETYYKFRTGPLDFRMGLLTETWGSGDKISFVDRLNSRRYHNGLANDYNRDKKEQACFRTTYYYNKRINVDLHYLPVFQASELPGIFSRWATTFQKSVAQRVLMGATYQQEKDPSLKDQMHIAINTSYKSYEARYHYFRFKDRVGVVDGISETNFRLMYPFEETFAVDGNIPLSKDSLMRFEMAMTKNKTFSKFEGGIVGRAFTSDQYNMLLGTDKNFPGSLYMNVQVLVSYVPDLRYRTPFQIAEVENSAAIQLKKGFNKDTLFVEVNGVGNLSTGEYILTPQVVYQINDYLKVTTGVHVNGKSTESMGPIGQFDKNNTAYFETLASF
jgi:hypothetical protein